VCDGPVEDPDDVEVAHMLPDGRLCHAACCWVCARRRLDDGEATR
jgi:hypothetical protein